MKWKEEHYSRYQQESYALPGQELEAIWHYVRQRKHLKYDTDHDENAKRISKKEWNNTQSWYQAKHNYIHFYSKEHVSA